MATTTLVEFPVEGGRNLLRRMDGAGLNVIAAFWRFSEAREQWELVLASPISAQRGGHYLLGEINGILESMSPEEREDLSLLDLNVLSPQFNGIEAMRKRLGPKTENTNLLPRRTQPGWRETYFYRL